MEFKKYNSIENSYRKKFLDKIVEEGHSGKEFVVTEKIHGSNFSFWMDSSQTRFAKRTAFLKEGDGFFNYEEVVKKYYDQMREMFDFLNDNGASEVVVYGELYGGEYPHPDVPKNHQKAVQKHVYYSPEQDFIAFDLKIDGQYVNVYEFEYILSKFNIPLVETLYRGSLEECLRFDNNYKTTIPKKHGLPEIEGNICEGNVIKPVEPTFLWSRERLILKNKNESFAEKHGVTKKKNKTPKEPVEISEEAHKAIASVKQYITENRLRNVLSKIGEVGQKDFGKIMGLFTQDIIDDFMKDEEDIFNKLEKKERKIVTKSVGQHAAQLLRKNFLNIIDGEF